jgi:hypothetical protein
VDGQEEELSLYQRLQREAVQEEEREYPQRGKHQRMRAYIRSRRRNVPGGGGYVTSEEMREEHERHLADLQALCNLVVNGARGPGEGYRLAYLKRKCPPEYAHLRDIEISSK